MTKERKALEFWRRWTRSNYMLTYSGSYEQDELYHQDLWHDVYLIDWLYAQQKQAVETLLRDLNG